jgi:hypothetical protein
MKYISPLFLGLLFWHPASAVADVTEATCKADYNAMIEATEQNREASLAELNASLRLTNDEDAAGSINNQINQTWEMEEQFRNHAATAFRDCMNYVKSVGS